MRSDVQVVNEALTLFAEGERGVFLRGKGQDIAFKAMIADAARYPAIPGTSALFHNITQDIWNISTIVERLHWTRARACHDGELRDKWMSYAAADIQAVHVEIRSVLDYVAQIVPAFCPKPGQLPDASFRKLLKWVGDNPNRIDGVLRSVLLEQETWFMEVRGTRDLLLHLGGFAIVFGGPEDGILFQIFKAGWRKVVDKPFLMYNENVAYFERYAALYLARLLMFLEDLATVLEGMFDVPVADPKTENYALGHAVIRSWVRDLHLLLLGTSDGVA